jgi:hypothetical protein
MMISTFAIDEVALELPRGVVRSGRRAGGGRPPGPPRRRRGRSTPGSFEAAWGLCALLAGLVAVVTALGVANYVEIKADPQLYFALMCSPPLGEL